MPGKQISVFVDERVHKLCRARKLNISRIVNTTLRILLEVDTSLQELKDEEEEITIKLAALVGEIRRREDEQIEALTARKVQEEYKKERERKIKRWVEVRDSKIKQEGKVPAAMRRHYAKEIGCTLKDLDGF